MIAAPHSGEVQKPADFDNLGSLAGKWNGSGAMRCECGGLDPKCYRCNGTGITAVDPPKRKRLELPSARAVGQLSDWEAGLEAELKAAEEDRQASRPSNKKRP